MDDNVAIVLAFADIRQGSDDTMTKSRYMSPISFVSAAAAAALALVAAAESFVAVDIFY